MISIDNRDGAASALSGGGDCVGIAPAGLGGEAIDASKRRRRFKIIPGVRRSAHGRAIGGGFRGGEETHIGVSTIAKIFRPGEA